MVKAVMHSREGLQEERCYINNTLYILPEMDLIYVIKTVILLLHNRTML